MHAAVKDMIGSSANVLWLVENGFLDAVHAAAELLIGQLQLLLQVGQVPLQVRIGWLKRQTFALYLYLCITLIHIFWKNKKSISPFLISLCLSLSEPYSGVCMYGQDPVQASAIFLNKENCLFLNYGNSSSLSLSLYFSPLHLANPNTKFRLGKGIRVTANRKCPSIFVFIFPRTPATRSFIHNSVS